MRKCSTPHLSNVNISPLRGYIYPGASGKSKLAEMIVQSLSRMNPKPKHQTPRHRSHYFRGHRNPTHTPLKPAPGTGTGVTPSSLRQPSPRSWSSHSTSFEQAPAIVVGVTPSSPRQSSPGLCRSTTTSFKPLGHSDDSRLQRTTVSESRELQHETPSNASVQYPEIHHTKMNFPLTQKTNVFVWT